MESYMWILWAVIAVVALIVEASTAALVSIWFVVGGILALATSFIPNFPFWAEIIIFVAGSLITFALFRPFLSTLMKKRVIKTNSDSLLGKKGVVLSEITDLTIGSVKVGGLVWSAIPADPSKTIQKDSIVVIKAIEGNKLLVEENHEEMKGENV